MAEEQKVSLGRIVHYRFELGENRPVTAPAIVTDIDREGLVSLTVFGFNNTFYKVSVKYAEEPTLSCWSWPPKV